MRVVVAIQHAKELPLLATDSIRVLAIAREIPLAFWRSNVFNSIGDPTVVGSFMAILVSDAKQIID